MGNKTFKTRPFFSIGMLFSFLILVLSGIGLFVMNYQSPTFVLVCFKSAHIAFALIFMFFSIGHIWINWRHIRLYVKGNAKKSISKEMIAGLLVIIIVLVISWLKAIDMANEHGIPF